MPRKRLPPDDPHTWLARAASNLACAQANIPKAFREDLCFAAQQAAEKALKAVCIRRKVSFPRVHDLTALLDLLQVSGLKIPKYVRGAGKLTRFAVETRYPGLYGSVTQTEYRRAVRIAEAVLHWAGRQIEKPYLSPSKPGEP